jgi:hypothetical protein
MERAADRIARHFGDLRPSELVTVEKVFPTTTRPDLEAAIGSVLNGRDADFIGINCAWSRYQTLTYAALSTESREPPLVGAAQYMDIDVGDAVQGRCIVAGAWLFAHGEGPAALLVSQVTKHVEQPGVRIEAIMSEGAGGREAAQALLATLAQRFMAESVYRGRALSFATSYSYGGSLGDLKVHRLPKLALSDVILPQQTLETLDRTVFGFLNARAALREHGFASKRGILLYGPPGTGKTHFVRYLLSQLPDHTSLIVTAEQVAFFDEIMAIARALQPSIVVIEDADLIAADRDRLRSDCSEVLLNSLLNHMDGLTDDAEIVFVLTTNRPEALEAAIRDRPGRIDQAIEIPKPDAECRARLLDLYRGKMEIAPAVSDQCVKRTANASAAFMKELARRMAQFAILRGDQRIVETDMRLAFEEMLGSGAFTAIALGADAVE